MHEAARRLAWALAGLTASGGRPVLGQGGDDAALRISQEDAPALAEGVEGWSPTPWRAQIEPMLWYAGLQGSVQAPGSTDEPDLEDLELDDSELTPGFEVMFRDAADEGTIRVSGFVFSQDGDAPADRAFMLGDLSIGAGERFESEIDYTSIEASYAWAWLHYRSPSSQRATRGFDLRVDPFVGLRGYHVRFEAASAGGEVSEDETWVDVVGGLRVEAEFSDELSLDLTVDAGGMWLGDTASGSAQVWSGFQWRPSRRFGAQIGYRFLSATISDDDDADETLFSGSLAGLYGSLVWRF